VKRNTGGKITTHKHGYPFLDCGIRWGKLSFIFLSKWSEFPSAPSFAGNKFDDTLRIDVTENALRITCFLSASVTRKGL